MHANNRGHREHDGPLVELTVDEVVDRYVLHSARKTPISLHGLHSVNATILWCWEGFRRHVSDGYGPCHVWICAQCPMRSADDKKVKGSKGMQTEQISLKAV